jgi:hypothetical protein
LPPSLQTLDNVENDIFFPASREVVEDFIPWLNLSDSEGALAHLMRRKAGGLSTELSEEARAEILSEKFLFAEHIDTIPQPVIPEEEKTFLNEVKAQPTFGDALKFGRLKKGLGQKDFGDPVKGGMNKTRISEFEHNKHVPDDLPVMKISARLGYTIFDEVTWVYLEKAKNARLHSGELVSGGV